MHIKILGKKREQNNMTVYSKIEIELDLNNYNNKEIIEFI